MKSFLSRIKAKTSKELLTTLHQIFQEWCFIRINLLNGLKTRLSEGFNENERDLGRRVRFRTSMTERKRRRWEVDKSQTIHLPGWDQIGETLLQNSWKSRTIGSNMSSSPLSRPRRISRCPMIPSALWWERNRETTKSRETDRLLLEIIIILIEHSL